MAWCQLNTTRRRVKSTDIRRIIIPREFVWTKSYALLNQPFLNELRSHKTERNPRTEVQIKITENLYVFLHQIDW